MLPTVTRTARSTVSRWSSAVSGPDAVVEKARQAVFAARSRRSLSKAELLASLPGGRCCPYLTLNVTSPTPEVCPVTGARPTTSKLEGADFEVDSSLQHSIPSSPGKCPIKGVAAGFTSGTQAPIKNKIESVSDYGDLFRGVVADIKAEGRYREFKTVKRVANTTNISIGSQPPPAKMASSVHGCPVHSDTNAGVEPEAVVDAKKEATVWCSNDYLAMGSHPVVTKAAMDTIMASGVGAGGTRNISGTSGAIANLETSLTKLHDIPSLVFTSGYVANDACLSTLAKSLPGLVMFSDEYNHASMIEGMRRNPCKRHVFRHNDVDHLEELLAAAPRDAPKIVAFESVYSMSGTVAPIRRICEIAAKYNALTFLDEVHAVGMYGAHGGGIAEAIGLQGEIDIISGTLAKGFGVHGGYISAKSPDLVDMLRSSASGFIFSTALPPPVAAAGCASIDHLMESSVEREVMHARVEEVKKAVSAQGLPLLPNPSHIIPIMVGDPVLCKQASERLLNHHNIYVQPINYPTVPRGTERLRVTVSPRHTTKQCEELVSALTETWNHLDAFAPGRTALATVAARGGALSSPFDRSNPQSVDQESEVATSPVVDLVSMEAAAARVLKGSVSAPEFLPLDTLAARLSA